MRLSLGKCTQSSFWKKQASTNKENVENTNDPAKNKFDNGGSYSPPRGMKDILKELPVMIREPLSVMVLKQ